MQGAGLCAQDTWLLGCESVSICACTWLSVSVRVSDACMFVYIRVCEGVCVCVYLCLRPSVRACACVPCPRAGSLPSLAREPAPS